MAISQQFKDTVYALSLELKRQGKDCYFDTYALLALAEAVHPTEAAPVYGAWTGKQLVEFALSDPECAGLLRDRRRIDCIRRLRKVTGNDLRTTNDASKEAQRRLGVTQVDVR